jgi:4-hydroxy-4-methyl-2-oxoglutarate aldolase
MTHTEIVERLERVDSCAVSDALEVLGLQGAALGIHSISVSKRVAGRVITMDLAEYGGTTSSRHLGTAAIDAAEPGDVIVVANGGRDTVSGWGGVLSAGATQRGVAGVITDGAARDVDQAASYGLPVYASGAVPQTARGRVIERAWNVQVTIAGVDVAPGDFVVADGSGVVFVPADRVDEVLAKAEYITAKEELMASRALAGEPMVEVMGRDYESMLNGQTT